MMRAATSKLLALALAALLAWAAFHFPFNKALLYGALAAYAGLLWWRPRAWLLVVPALLPVLDLAPWTGWFYLEELDLLLLASAAVGYWRLGARPPEVELPRFAVFALGLAGLATAIAAWIGAAPLPPLDANAFAHYSSPYNSLRVAKGYAWALLLLPLLRRSAGPGMESLRGLFVPGMLIGLGLTALAVLWERALFPGVLNFSSDYRPTATFSAMHTGGAALDAYLAAALPFVTLWLIGPHTRRQWAAGMVLLGLGLFTGFTTFSRDVYLAYGVAGAIIGLLLMRNKLRQRTLAPRALLAGAALLAVCAGCLTLAFSSGGYRSLLAGIVLLGAALALATAGERMRHWPLWAGAAPLLLLLVLALFFLTGGSGMGKGPYLGFTLATAAFGAGAALLWWGPARLRPQGMALAAAALPAMALGDVLVAYHWGGAAAGGHALLVVAAAAGVVALNRLPLRPLLQLNRGTVTFALLSAILLGTVIPVAGSYYMGSRFATVSNDLDVRLRHWDDALQMMRPDWQTALFGMGLGRYPATYFWQNARGEMPGSFSYEQEGGNPFLRLTSPHHAIGYGEVLRTLQQVTLTPNTPYRLSLDVRSKTADTRLRLGLCERWLIYPQNCVYAALPKAQADGQWQHVEVMLNSGRLGQGGLSGPPVQFEMSNEARFSSVDVDNLSLRRASDGREMLDNGSFGAGNNHWFFSSDRDHFPWHVKNFYVNAVFEQGWFGAAATALLLLYAAGMLGVRGWHGELAPAVYLAALAGMLVVGLFDTLVDVPRLTLLMALLLIAGLLQPVPPKPARRRRRGTAREAELTA